MLNNLVRFWQLSFIEFLIGRYILLAHIFSNNRQQVDLVIDLINIAQVSVTIFIKILRKRQESFFGEHSVVISIKLEHTATERPHASLIIVMDTWPLIEFELKLENIPFQHRHNIQPSLNDGCKILQENVVRDIIILVD